MCVCVIVSLLYVLARYSRCSVVVVCVCDCARCLWEFGLLGSHTLTRTSLNGRGRITIPLLYTVRNVLADFAVFD